MLQTRQQNIQYGDDTYPRDLSLILPNQRMHTKFGILPVCVIARARGKCLSICLPTSSFMLLPLYVFSWSSQVYKNVSSLKYDLFIVFWICPYFLKYSTQKKAFQLALEIKRKEIYWISSQSHMLYLASPKFSWREVCLHDNSTANSSWELENTMVKKTFHQSGQRINPQIEWASQSK